MKRLTIHNGLQIYLDNGVPKHAGVCSPEEAIERVKQYVAHRKATLGYAQKWLDRVDGEDTP